MKEQPMRDFADQSLDISGTSPATARDADHFGADRRESRARAAEHVMVQGMAQQILRRVIVPDLAGLGPEATCL